MEWAKESIYEASFEVKCMLQREQSAASGTSQPRPEGAPDWSDPFSEPITSRILNHVIHNKTLDRMSLVVTCVDRYRIVEVVGLSKGSSCTFYTYESELPYIKYEKQYKEFFGAVDGDAFQMPNVSVSEKPDILSEYNINQGHVKSDLELDSSYLNSHRQFNNYNIIGYKFGVSSVEIVFLLNIKMSHYFYGNYCNALPIPGKHRGKNDGNQLSVNVPEIVVSSPVVQQALTELNEVWQNAPSSVLISSPPGSGKENFALSIPYGCGKDGDKVQSLSLANGEVSDQERMLYGYQQDDGTIVDGLIAEAKGSAIFVDEAHYPLDKVGIRSSLLRPLESKKYYPVGSSQEKKVENVQWVFASSKPLKGETDSLTKTKPPDFWTRMAYVMRIEHPLDIAEFKVDKNGTYIDRVELVKSVIQDYFKFFWWKQASDHFGLDPEVAFRKEENKLDINEGYLLRVLDIDKIRPLSDAFAESFLEVIGIDKLRDTSIRGIRSMVSLIFSPCVGCVETGESASLWGAYFNQKPEITLEVNEEIKRVIEKIQQIANLAS